MAQRRATDRRGSGMVRLGLVGLLCLAGCASLGDGASAALPEIRTSQRNRVPACVTPDRLMQFVRRHNGSLDPKLRGIAEEYRRHGEKWRVRWDYAFFQAMVETNYLTFRAPGGRMGDVHPRQNNFAGIGATGGGVPGDAYPDVSTGVLAQIQHLVVYSGERLSNPVAPRTRLKMDEILGKSAALGRPVTFADLSRRWALDPRYGSAIEHTARSFRATYCSGRNDVVMEQDSRRLPKRLAERPAREEVEDEEPKRLRKPLTRSEELPGRSAALERGRRAAPAEEDAKPRAAVKKSEPPKREEPAARPAAAPPPPAPPAAKAPAAPAAPAAPRPPATGTMPAPPSATGPGPGPGQGQACKVFTASYGGPKSVLIQAQKDGVVNYTVLEVVAGKEQDQARAFIAAYAQGGKTVGEFGTREEALKKAFELCPKE